MARAREAQYRRRVESALGEIERSLEGRDSRRCYIAYSGGKDSTVVAHLVHRVEPRIAVICGTSGAAMQHDIDEIAALAAAQGLRLRLVGFPALHAYDLVFVGLRAEESRRRARRIAFRDYWAGVEECWPLATWSWFDVWAYIVEHGIPYLAIYDQLAEMGIGYDRSRHHWAFGRSAPAQALAHASDGVLRWRSRHICPGPIDS